MAVASPVPEQIVEGDDRLVPHHGGGGPGGRDRGGRGGGGGGGDDGSERWSPGVYRVGMWATITAVSTVFVTMAFAYLARSRNPEFWDPLRLPRILWASTALILLSSASCEAARRAVRRGAQGAARLWLGVTLTLGCIFLSTQLRAWTELNSEGVFVAANPHSFFLYLFTAVHGLHLLLGLLLLWYLFMRAVLPFWRDNNPARRRELADAGALYWHFMDGIWVALFVLLLVKP
ncbi:MAG TPA: cytochrome c oxidase subunit 3 [Bryobacteraceae bacterium]|nr:cytochrome c oxidase subunit 3 [Bryobacteraceae bacterium]